ncbi:MAG: zinc-dependent peptidase [Betaproteobacteria bacterium]|nr:zinc-dependent peptidase [Betaproteobacteria bacterium]
MLGWLKRVFGEKKPFQPIREDLWGAATAPYLFMRGLSPAEREKLRLIASDFLHRKRIVGAADHEVTDLMRVQIAAQACILVLELGLDYLDGWSDIILYPGQFVPEREVTDEAGVVHTVRDPLAGEAWLGGPVVLSYEDVARSSNEDERIEGFNVVIHEFAHKLDMLNGEPNGYPPLHKGMNSETWKRAFMEAYLDFCKRVDDADAHSHHRGDAAYADLPIDPYGSENPAEFFAVISEAFFETPDLVKEDYPAAYEQLKLFYKQDPLARLAG